MNICLSCDDNYSPHAGTVIASILLNSSENDKYCFYILDSNISKNNKDKILQLKKLKLVRFILLK